jgi:hypothetical protein
MNTRFARGEAAAGAPRGLTAERINHLQRRKKEMNTPDNQNSTTRTSAAQIGEEKDKAELLWEGIKARHRVDHPDASLLAQHALAVGQLTAYCEMLTSRSKSDRDYAKSEIRELVKLGKEK